MATSKIKQSAFTDWDYIQSYPFTAPTDGILRLFINPASASGGFFRGYLNGSVSANNRIYCQTYCGEAETKDYTLKKGDVIGDNYATQNISEWYGYFRKGGGNT